MQSIISKYKASGNLILDLPFLKNTLLDQSGNGNNAVATTSYAKWVSNASGRDIRFRATGRLTVADSPSLRYTECTIFIYMDGNSLPINHRIWCHRGVAGNKVEIYYSNGTITIGTALSTAFIVYTITGKERLITVKIFGTATPPKFYIDGVFIGNANQNLICGDAITDLIIGNYYDGGTALPIPVGISRVIAFNTTAVTDDEITKIYDCLIRDKGSINTDVSGFIAPSLTSDGTKIVYRQDFKNVPPTFTDVTVGDIPFTQFQVISGTWAIRETASGKYLYCVASGQVKDCTPIGADALTTKVFTVSGSPTLTKNATDIRIDATNGEKIYEIILGNI